MKKGKNQSKKYNTLPAPLQKTGEKGERIVVHSKDKFRINFTLAKKGGHIVL